MTFKLLNAALMTVQYLGFIWSTFFYFKKSNFTNIPILLIKVIGTVLMLANIYFIYSQTLHINILSTLGSILILFSSFLFYWTLLANKDKEFHFAFTNLETVNIIATGPYRYIRHPFYASYTFAWLGASLINQNMLLLILSLILVFLYFKAATDEERSFLKGPAEPVYLAYMKSTGKFFPRIFKL